jgi:hypothetical protein
MANKLYSFEGASKGFFCLLLKKKSMNSLEKKNAKEKTLEGCKKKFANKGP